MLATRCAVYTPRRVHDIRQCLYAKSGGMEKNIQICASHQLKSEPFDHLPDVILSSKVELANRCVRSFAIQCVRLFEDLVLATTMFVVWMKMTRPVTFLTANCGFAIPG